MSTRVLVPGVTGTLGRPVVRSLVERGFTARVLIRSAEKAHRECVGTAEWIKIQKTYS